MGVNAKRLNDSEVDKLQKRLDERLNVLTQAIRSDLIASGEQHHIRIAGRVHDTKDQSFATLLGDVNVGRVQLHAAELNDVEAACTRIRAGTFGQCVDCGQAIGMERLGAYPTAKRCLSCQQEYERNKR